MTPLTSACAADSRQLWQLYQPSGDDGPLFLSTRLHGVSITVKTTPGLLRILQALEEARADDRHRGFDPQAQGWRPRPFVAKKLHLAEQTVSAYVTRFRRQWNAELARHPELALHRETGPIVRARKLGLRLAPEAELVTLQPASPARPQAPR